MKPVFWTVVIMSGALYALSSAANLLSSAFGS
jgi:hypothetical protein